MTKMAAMPIYGSQIAEGAVGLGIIRGNKVETVMLNSDCNNYDK